MGQLLFLGTGASLGVPIIGCSCLVCTSSSPFNQRLRPSVLIHAHQKTFLIDVGPDFRTQALRHHVHQLDGVLLTHAHQDHIAGLDDLRPIYYKRSSPVPLLLSKETAQDMQRRYHYLFDSVQGDTFVSHLKLQELPDAKEGRVLFEDVSIDYVSYEQGGMTVNGFCFGNLAYLSDMRHFPSTIFQHLKGIHTLVISALGYTPSALHFSIDEAIEFAQQIEAKVVWLTHLSHELEYEKASAYLPPHVKLAYDGLEIDFNDVRISYNDQK